MDDKSRVRAWNPVAVLFSCLVLGTVHGAARSENFGLALPAGTIPVAAGGTASATLQITAASGYSQPVYLIPGPLPDGVSVHLSSPIIGSQRIAVDVRVAATVKVQRAIPSLSTRQVAVRIIR